MVKEKTPEEKAQREDWEDEENEVGVEIHEGETTKHHPHPRALLDAELAEWSTAEGAAERTDTESAHNVRRKKDREEESLFTYHSPKRHTLSNIFFFFFFFLLLLTTHTRRCTHSSSPPSRVTSPPLCFRF